MRRLVATVGFCLVLGTSTTAWAQGGAIVGVNLARLKFTGQEDVPDPERRTALLGGIFYRLRLAQTVTIQPEVLYSRKGAKLTEGAAEVTIELDYIDVPVLLRLSGSGGGGLVFFGGPSFAYKLRARGKTKFEGETTEEDIGEEIEDFDLGFIVGAGIGSDSFFLDGRYQWGMTDIDTDDTDEAQVKNRVVSFVLGFRF